MKTSSAGLSGDLVVSDIDGLERSQCVTFVGENQWHLYQWNFDNAGVWDALPGGTGNGTLTGLMVTFQSLQLNGADAQSATVYVDDL